MWIIPSAPTPGSLDLPIYRLRNARALFAHIELGNLLLKRGAREGASLAYSEALRHAANDPDLRRSIEVPSQTGVSESLGQVPELRNPLLE
jgi:hypothetical protein